jgi:hypothetical protein
LKEKSSSPGSGGERYYYAGIAMVERLLEAGVIVRKGERYQMVDAKKGVETLAKMSDEILAFYTHHTPEELVQYVVSLRERSKHGEVSRFATMVKEVKKTNQGNIQTLTLEASADFKPRSSYITSLRINFYESSEDLLKAMLGNQIDGFGFSQFDQRASIPQLTEESKRSVVKLVKEKLEEARVSVRLERQRADKDIDAQEKAGEFAEDDKFRAKEELQKMVDTINSQLESLFQKKETDVMTV